MFDLLKSVSMNLADKSIENIDENYEIVIAALIVCIIAILVFSFRSVGAKVSNEKKELSKNDKYSQEIEDEISFTIKKRKRKK